MSAYFHFYLCGRIAAEWLINMNLQDAIIKEIVTERVPVTLYLNNAFQMRGTITGFDSFVIVLVTDGRQQMIYKHSISTIAPIRPIKAAAVKV